MGISAFDSCCGRVATNSFRSKKHSNCSCSSHQEILQKYEFCVSHHPLVLVDEKGMEIPQFHGEDELFRFGKIRDNSVLPDVCYALKFEIIGVEIVSVGKREFHLPLGVSLAPAEYSDRWCVDAVENDKYCFIHPIMGKLKLPQSDFPELKVGEWVVLKQVVYKPWWNSAYSVSYQFVKK